MAWSWFAWGGETSGTALLLAACVRLEAVRFSRASLRRGKRRFLRTQQIVGGLRVDHWELFDGFRKETVRATGAVLTDFTICGSRRERNRWGKRRAREGDGRGGGSRRDLHRIPCSERNELYRPFRVGNDVTEADPALNPDILLGASFGSGNGGRRRTARISERVPGGRD